jgi:hypothetical protein
VYDWAEAHPHSFPPIVVNITGGQLVDEPYDGADLRSWAKRLTTIGTHDGEALLFTVFLSESTAQQVRFPAAAHQLPDPGGDLLAMSSVLPPEIVAKGGQGYPMTEGARAFCMNAGPEPILPFLEIGTRVWDVRH